MLLQKEGKNIKKIENIFKFNNLKKSLHKLIFDIKFTCPNY